MQDLVLVIIWMNARWSQERFCYFSVRFELNLSGNLYSRHFYTSEFTAALFLPVWLLTVCMQACTCKSTAKGQRSDYSHVFITCEMVFGGLGSAAGPMHKKDAEELEWTPQRAGCMAGDLKYLTYKLKQRELGFFSLEQRLGVCRWSHGGINRK